MRNKNRKIIALFMPLIALACGFFINYEKKIEKEAIIARQMATIDKINSLDFSEVKLENLKALDILSSRDLKRGKEEASKHKLVVVGISRDNIEAMLTTIKNVENIGSFFKDYRVIIFENDSKDGTKQALDAWQKNSKVKVISEEIGNRKRINHKFMAEIRNKYLKALQNEEYNDFDLVMVLDMDMSYGIDPRGIFDSLSKIDQWDGVCSNGIANKHGKMYDAFAFRNHEFPFSPEKWQKICEKQTLKDKYTKYCDYNTSLIHDLIGFRLGFQAPNRLYWLKIVPQIQKTYNIDSELIPVYSCFGGMAIYKKSFIKDCNYDSINNDCEHVYFHECLEKNNHFRMMFNPSQVIRYSHYENQL